MHLSKGISVGGWWPGLQIVANLVDFIHIFFNHNILMIGIFWAFVNLQARDTHRIRCETPFYHSVTTRTFSDLLYTFPGLYLKVIWQRTMIQNEHRGLWTTYLEDLIIEDYLVEI